MELNISFAFNLYSDPRQVWQIWPKWYLSALNTAIICCQNAIYDISLSPCLSNPESPLANWLSSTAAITNSVVSATANSDSVSARHCGNTRHVRATLLSTPITDICSQTMQIFCSESANLLCLITKSRAATRFSESTHSNNYTEEWIFTNNRVNFTRVNMFKQQLIYLIRSGYTSIETKLRSQYDHFG